MKHKLTIVGLLLLVGSTAEAQQPGISNPYPSVPGVQSQQPGIQQPALPNTQPALPTQPVIPNQTQLPGTTGNTNAGAPNIGAPAIGAPQPPQNVMNVPTTNSLGSNAAQPCPADNNGNPGLSPGAGSTNCAPGQVSGPSAGASGTGIGITGSGGQAGVAGG